MPREPGGELDPSDRMQGCPLAAPLSTAGDHLAGTAGPRPSRPAELSSRVLSALGSRMVGAHPRGPPPAHPCE